MTNSSEDKRLDLLKSSVVCIFYRVCSEGCHFKDYICTLHNNTHTPTNPAHAQYRLAQPPQTCHIPLRRSWNQCAGEQNTQRMECLKAHNVDMTVSRCKLRNPRPHPYKETRVQLGSGSSLHQPLHQAAHMAPGTLHLLIYRDIYTLGWAGAR